MFQLLICYVLNAESSAHSQFERYSHCKYEALHLQSTAFTKKKNRRRNRRHTT